MSYPFKEGIRGLGALTIPPIRLADSREEGVEKGRGGASRVSKRWIIDTRQDGTGR
ncbi:hypothetical protein HYR99_37005 [Candidatus Poribacteria bacterium]|nr:hypothetical protein [Candidatus Poribacteria bacterium]